MKKGLTYILGFLIVIVTLLSIITPDISIFKQFSEYSVLIMFTLLSIGLIALSFSYSKLMYISFLCTGALALFLKDASNTELRYPEENNLACVRIAHFNLSNVDHDFKDVIGFISEKNPDIVTFQEYTPEWSNILNNKMKELYHFSRKEVRIDPFGMAVYSKQKLENPKIIKYNGVPNLIFQTKLNNKNIEMVLSYILPPVLNYGNHTTRQHLDFIGEAISNNSLPTILVGDFNMVYWSSEIRDFRKKYNLNNSRKNSTSFGLSVPYDHMFYTNELECASLEELVNSNGEHIGISGVFQTANPNENNRNYIGMRTKKTDYYNINQ